MVSRVAGFSCPLIETTGQIVAEQRLASEIERQRRMFEQAPGFITVLRGPDYVFEFVNEAYARLFGDRGFLGEAARTAFPELAIHFLATSWRIKTIRLFRP